MREADLAPAVNSGGRQLRWLWLSLVVLIVDQATKLIVSATLALYEFIPIMPSLNLTLLHNSGAAFSLLGSADGWQRWLFIGLAVGISVLILAWLRKLEEDQTWLAGALALVLGGAVGNLWDRINFGYVIDFIDVYYAEWHWPAFNVADSAITVGAVMLVIDAFRSERHE
jgi:signal peptidase II